MYRLINNGGKIPLIINCRVSSLIQKLSAVRTRSVSSWTRVCPTASAVVLIPVATSFTRQAKMVVRVSRNCQKLMAMLWWTMKW